ncbi:MAG: hypothetical protein IPH62_00790 [Ignavibacteriae bacterium]|nr:hypothetical protein [Ignavibacteriota bacterium]
MKIKIFGVLLIIILISCNENSTESKNNDPILLSLQVFPKIVNSEDSVIVICEAVEPDEDSIFYDWFTDSRLKIKDNGNESILYHTRENTRVFYPTKGKDEPTDSAWISCSVRDGKGGQSVSKRVTILVVN